MKNFSFEKTDIKDLIIINPFYVEDERGIFLKSFENNTFKDNGIEFTTYEYFESTSKKGVLRGLHFQTKHPQAKLIRVPFGEILDVAVDLREESETFGKWYSIRLSNKNKKILYIPKGFAHGFLTLSEEAIVSYLCDGEYSKETDSGIVWNDKDLAINWQYEKIDEIIVSDRDKNLQSFKKFCIYK